MSKIALSLRWCVSVAYRSYVYFCVGTRGQKFFLVDCDTALSLALSNLHIAIAQDNGLNILSEFLRFSAVFILVENSMAIASRLSQNWDGRRNSILFYSQRKLRYL
ncbi:hypothetical protein [Nostoc sp. 'Peltigera malacea cyanobiont' DB3992]|uniref:hypothetical protein n=1 Tax=Nostoc sp. 'Peltigera malacea cyanobiont' DB3992 TaxID=1206980 RepID=UPI0011809131|nr:hypothetical protein [Nostoc sp. 'Peltigera malacea cyanobiont' DB3992]